MKSNFRTREAAIPTHIVFVAFYILLFAISLQSANAAASGSLVKLSNTNEASTDPQITASGNNIYVAWSTTTNNDILFKKIAILSNDTVAYGDTVSLDDNNEASTDPQITASGNNVYVAWSTTTNNDILFAASTDNGSSFGSIVNVSNNSGSSVEPRIVASGANAYIVWRDDTEILFKKTTIDGDSNTILGDVADLSSSPNGSFHPSIA